MTPVNMGRRIIAETVTVEMDTVKNRTLYKAMLLSCKLRAISGDEVTILQE